jgi:hypothetical protein
MDGHSFSSPPTGMIPAFSSLPGHDPFDAMWMLSKEMSFPSECFVLDWSRYWLRIDQSAVVGLLAPASSRTPGRNPFQEHLPNGIIMSYKKTRSSQWLTTLSNRTSFNHPTVEQNE